MIRLSIFVAVLALSLIALIGGSTTLGRAAPLPEEVAFLHLGDMCESPCWIGITPGQTTLEDAVAQLHKVYQDSQLLEHQDYRMDFAVVAPNGKKMRVSFDATNNPAHTVSYIVLIPADSRGITLGYAVSKLGAPQTYYDAASRLLHETYQLWILNSFRNYSYQDVITPQQEVTRIQLQQKTDAFSSASGYPIWNGFNIYNFEYVIPNNSDCSG